MTDPSYKTFSLIAVNSGLLARYQEDRPPNPRYSPDSTANLYYLDLTNLESRKENALSSRYGTSVPFNSNGTIATSFALPAAVYQIARMKGISGNIFNYAGSQAKLYRRASDASGAYTQVAAGLSGNKFTASIYRPDGNSSPYIFIADQSVMLKDNGAFNPLQTWGIFPPTIPPSLVVQNAVYKIIEEFQTNAGFTFASYTGVANPNRVNTTIGAIAAIGIQAATPASMSQILPGMLLNIDAGGNLEQVYVISITSTTFTANFTKTHLAGVAAQEQDISGSVAAGTTATVTKSVATDLTSLGGGVSTDDDLLNLWINVSDPAAIKEIKLMFDVGDGTFTQDYYWKAISPDTLQAATSGTSTALDTVASGVFSRAVGQRNLRQRGVTVDGHILPIDDPGLDSMQPVALDTGLGVWSLIQAAKSEFVEVGLAGIPGKSWANVNAFRVQITTIDTAGATVILSQLFLHGAAGLDVFGGVNYDYRITYYDANTFAESNPSQAMVSTSWVAPRRQAVKVGWTASTDTQVTHVRVYRRGGTLPTGWLKVAEVKIGTISFTDTFSDDQIGSNTQLQIDNDPPVTSTLKLPVDTTLGGVVTAGSTQTVAVASAAGLVANQYVTIDQDNAQSETVILQSVNGGGSTITAFFQIAHGNGARVTAATFPGRAMNLSVSAFQRMWLAGDAENPHMLYYSKAQRPESFSPASAVEVGTPDDPIMALIVLKGQMYVFTQRTAYIILAAGTPVPLPIPTGCSHGMVSSFGWAIVEGALWFLSYDGVYVFTGGEAQLVSENVDWIITGKALGPLSSMDTTQRASVTMAYVDKEVYISFLNKAAARVRLVWSLMYKRWRIDSVAATSMLYAQDTGILWFGDANGFIYQDRTGDSDFQLGVAGPVPTAIPVSLQTPYLDQQVPKSRKVYNEFTIDINTNGQDVTIQLLFENGTVAPIILPVVNTVQRTQVNLNINAGQGQAARNIAVKITANATADIDIFQMHVRATVEAEARKSYDSYWTKYGTDEFKIVKQAWLEYIAPDAAGITFNAYIEGSAVPQFSFTLPQATVRTAKRIRFPAVKAKVWRWVATSASDFQFYAESHFEVKPIGSQKGYQPAKIMQEAP